MRGITRIEKHLLRVLQEGSILLRGHLEVPGTDEHGLLVLVLKTGIGLLESQLDLLGSRLLGCLIGQLHGVVEHLRVLNLLNIEDSCFIDIDLHVHL